MVPSQYIHHRRKHPLHTTASNQSEASYCSARNFPCALTAFWSVMNNCLSPIMERFVFLIICFRSVLNAVSKFRKTLRCGFFPSSGIFPSSSGVAGKGTLSGKGTLDNDEETGGVLQMGKGTDSTSSHCGRGVSSFPLREIGGNQDSYCLQHSTTRPK